MIYNNIKIETDENGDVLIPLPEDLLKEMGWNEHTIFDTDINNKDLTITLRHKTEWSVEDAAEFLEDIIEDVVNNGILHYILDAEGKKYIIAPYDEQLYKMTKGE